MIRSTALLVLSLAGAGWLLSQGDVAVATPAPVVEDEESVLAGHMQDVMKHLRGIGGGLNAEEGPGAALEPLADLQMTLLHAKLETPSKAGDLSGEELDAFLAGYRKKLIELVVATLELETMILDGAPGEELMEKFKSFQSIKKVGHRAYK